MTHDVTTAAGGDLERLRARIGGTLVSDWRTVDQGLIDRFAEVTDDLQFIHIDPERAAETPFGGTVAHGFLLLSLLPSLHATRRAEMGPRPRIGINYGFERVRFVQPVRAGARVRAHFTLVEVEEKAPGRFQQATDVVLELEGSEKPAVVARWLGQFIL